MFTRLMQIQIWILPAYARCVSGGLLYWSPPLNTGAHHSYNVHLQAVWEEGITQEQWWLLPPDLTLQPHNSVSPHMFLVPLELLSLCWSLRWVNVSLCAGPLRGHLGFNNPPSHLDDFLLIVTARCCGDSCSWHWCSGLCFLVWGWDP